MTDARLDQLGINTIRTLSMDAVQAANSGHPGTPMALAPVAYCLWQRLPALRPARPDLAQPRPLRALVGHASMLLYSLLHLTGVKAVNTKYERLGEPSVPLDDIKRFRQLDSRCPGHPEYRWTTGVETTTGPLGQGLANSVGMAIAGRWMAAHFNRPGFADVRLQRLRPVRRRLHDGGHLQRGGLAGRPPEARQPVLDLRQQPHHHRGQHRRWPSATTWPRASSATAGTSPASATPTTWRCSTGPSAPSRRHDDRPTLIIVDSHIAYGAPNKQDTSAAHGEPLGEEEIRLTKRQLRLAGGREVPGARRRARALPGRASASAAARLRDAWMRLVRGVPAQASRAGRPALSDAAPRSCPKAGTRTCRPSPPTPRAWPTRDASGKVLNAIAQERALADRRLGRPGARPPRRG